MDLRDYQAAVESIPFGKRLPTALYICRSETTDLGPTVNRLLQQIVTAFKIGTEFNVVKFRTDDLKVSFLSYPGFFDDPHPELKAAATIDLRSGKVRHANYDSNPNPPILHRKETFLPPDHPNRAEFANLTRQEDEAGLFDQADTIGFKLNWERRLADMGLVLEGHSLRKAREPAAASPFSNGDIAIDRHKTALTRYDLSKPIKSLLEHGLLRTETTLLDYGCGQGTDVAGLQALGYSADGWDPIHRPDASRSASDVVSCEPK